MAKWKIDAGNSNTGPCGFVVYDVEAETAEEALQKVKDTWALPEHIEAKGEDDQGNETTVVAYFNANALTLDNVEEQDDDEAEAAADGEEQADVH